MTIVGITGGIGSGKSVISKLLQAMGYPVYDSDLEAKKIMHSDPQLKKELQKTFGSDIFSDGHLNTQRLANEVFGNTNRLHDLNNIVHPAVRRHIHVWKSKQTSPLLFVESAILFESGFDNEVHKIILITAPLEVRIARVIHRDHCTHEQVMQRIAQQWTEEAKAIKSNYIIVNDGQHSLIKQTENIVYQLINNL